jgi:2C-methyl-D-erythritol 2,4-cyclodiphosphate synthase
MISSFIYLLLQLTNSKLLMLLTRVEKIWSHFEKLQNTLKKKIKKESKQNNIRKIQLEKKNLEEENISIEVAKQKAELLQYKNKIDKNVTELLISLNSENEMVCKYYYSIYLYLFVKLTFFYK